MNNSEIVNFNYLFRENKNTHILSIKDVTADFLNQKETMSEDMNSEFDKWIEENSSKLSLELNKIKYPIFKNSHYNV